MVARMWQNNELINQQGDFVFKSFFPFFSLVSSGKMVANEPTAVYHSTMGTQV